MKRTERIQHINTYCMDTLARLYNSEEMQGVLNDYEARQARFAGVYNMGKVIFSESLDLNTITFTTKKAKHEFFNALFAICGI